MKDLQPLPPLGMDSSAIDEDFRRHLGHTLGCDEKGADDREKYEALALAVRDRLMERWKSTQQGYRNAGCKRAYYLSLEFLMGRALGNAVLNLGLDNAVNIALYEYGKPSLGANTGFVKQLAPLTNDLDAVSEALFALHTNGGSEYAGHVIQDAVKNLAWDKDDASLKMVFIAGNESFSQGPTDFREAISDAAEKGIVVNTIYCGNEGSEEYAGWQEGARLARGKTMSIDHNAVVQHIASPHDAEIARLSQELNSTYIAYGRGGNEKKARQVKQDKNVASDMRMSVGRAKSKVSGQYRNSSWDLVDAASEGADIGEMEEDALPAEMQGMSKSARRDHVAKTAKKRKALARKLRTLTEKRERFVAKTRKATPASAPTLKEGLMKVATEQAEAKGYKKK